MTTGAVITRNGTVPAQKPRTRAAPLGEPVGEVDDQRELRELGRVDRRQRPDLEPARRAADHDVDLRARTRASGSTIADDEQRHRHHAQPAVVDPHHHDHRDQAQRAPTGPAGRRSRTCRRVWRNAFIADERVDHQDADRGERDDATRITVLGLVALALERDLGACGCRPRHRVAAASDGPRSRGVVLIVASRAGGGDGRDERPCRAPRSPRTCRTTGRGRAQQDGRDGARRPVAQRRRGPARRRVATASSIDAGARRARERRRAPERRSRSGPLSPMSTAAAARLARRRRPARRRSTPLSRPPAISTIGGAKARSAAITASGCVPCESLTNRTPSTRPTG